MTITEVIARLEALRIEAGEVPVALIFNTCDGVFCIDKLVEMHLLQTPHELEGEPFLFVGVGAYELFHPEAEDKHLAPFGRHLRLVPPPKNGAEDE